MRRRKTMMNVYVAPEIVSEIFLNLSCKSLCRFRSVSKRYKSYINNLQFIEEHRRRNMKPSHLLIFDVNVRSNLHLFSMSMDGYAYIKTIPTNEYKFALPSSYGGMVCFHGHSDSKKIALFNPSSEEIIPLPDLVVSSAYLETLTEWGRHSLGFDFDPKSRRYKIIHLITEGTTISRVHILTFTHNSDSSWRTISVSDKAFIRCPVISKPICVDGVLYWEIWDVDNEEDLVFDYIRVLVFDLRTEEMQIIQSPVKRRWNRPEDQYGIGDHLQLLEGKLCCYDMAPPIDKLLKMNIWKLEHDFNNNKVDWTFCYKFEIYGPELEFCPLIPIYIYDSKTFLFWMKEFYCYDIQDKSLKTYPMAGNFEGVANCLRLAVHSETINHSLD